MKLEFRLFCNAHVHARIYMYGWRGADVACRVLHTAIRRLKLGLACVFGEGRCLICVLNDRN